MNPKTSSDLFNKIRSQFSNIQIGGADGQPTADPQEAVFFDFEFAEDKDTFGRVSISLADGENMKVFYNRDLVSKIDEDSRSQWYAFLKELKDFVATGLSYKAKPGQHDDLVSSCLLMTRMMKVLADFDPKIFERWTDRTSEWTAPMPIFANLYG